MNTHEDESTVPTVPLARPAVASDALRRALRFGERAAGRFGGLPFDEIEGELRADWERRSGEAAWAWVRAAVRAGYEQDADDT